MYRFGYARRDIIDCDELNYVYEYALTNVAIADFATVLSQILLDDAGRRDYDDDDSPTPRHDYGTPRGPCWADGRSTREGCPIDCLTIRYAPSLGDHVDELRAAVNGHGELRTSLDATHVMRNGCGGPRADLACGMLTMMACGKCVTWMKVSRVGEARHPGPAHAGSGGPGELPDVATRVMDHGDAPSVQYATPGNGGFDRIVAPGLAEACGTRSGPDEFKLIVETVNTTGWAALRRRLQATRAHAVLAQET